MRGPARPAAETSVARADARPRSVRATVLRLRRDSTVVVSVAVLVAVTALGLQQHRMAVLTGDVEPQMVANQQLGQAVTAMDGGVRGYRLTRDASFLTPYEAAQPVLHDALSTLQDGAGDGPTRRVVDAQQTAITTWLASVVNLGDRSPTDLAASAAAFTTVQQANAAVDHQLLEVRDRLRTRAVLTTAAGVGVLVLVALLGMVVLQRRSRSTLREVVPPLEHLRDVVDELGRGRAGALADADHGVEEIQTVAAAINGLADANQQQRSTLDAQIALNDEVRTIAGLTQGSLDIPAIVSGSARTVAVGLRADAVWIRAFDAAGGQPGRGWAATYPAAPDDPATPQTRVPQRLIDAVRAVALLAWQRQSPTLLAPSGGELDAADHAGVLAILDHTGCETLLVVPIGVGPECLGYFAVARRRERSAWNEPERQAAMRIGRDLGRSILTARLFAREREVVEQLRALDDEKDQFVSTASHELRTPLTAILGHIQLVNDGTLGPVPAELASSIDAVDRNSQRLRLLIDDLLSLSRLGQPTPLRPTAVDLVQLVDEVVAVHRFTADQRRIRIELDTDGEPLDVSGNRDELERAFSHTLDNAVRFSPSGALVRVVVQQADGEAEVVVSDSGLGISADDQQRLFSRFFRSTNPEALAIAGTGLGLTITRSIVEKHHGSVTVESDLGQGTAVRFRLPTRAAVADRVAP